MGIDQASSEVVYTYVTTMLPGVLLNSYAGSIDHFLKGMNFTFSIVVIYCECNFFRLENCQQESSHVILTLVVFNMFIRASISRFGIEWEERNISRIITSSTLLIKWGFFITFNLKAL
jgi:hypothetical protein